MKSLELLNFEGPVLIAEQTELGTYLIFDQWKNAVNELSRNELIQFFDGNFEIEDSSGKFWNWSIEHDDAKPSIERIDEFLN